MYTQFYQLDTLPFSIAPNTRFLYLTKGHQAVLKELEDAINGQVALSVLLGEVGTGKTTLSRALIEDLPPEIRTALILNPRLTPAEFLQTILDELQVDYEGIKRSIRGLRRVLTQYVKEQEALGHRILILVDEAQQLRPGILEQIESMILEFGALETPVSFILVGQPELNGILKGSRYEELYELVAHHCVLQPMSFSECQGYIVHRLGIAGTQKTVFTPRALGEIHQLSAGIPRLINLICDRSLLLGYSSNMALINSDMVKKASAELRVRSEIKQTWPLKALSRQRVLGVLGSGVIVGVVYLSYMPVKNYWEGFSLGSAIIPIKNRLDFIGGESIHLVDLLNNTRRKALSLLNELSLPSKNPSTLKPLKDDSEQARLASAEGHHVDNIQPERDKVDTSFKTKKEPSDRTNEGTIPGIPTRDEKTDRSQLPVISQSKTLPAAKPSHGSGGTQISEEYNSQNDFPEFLLWVKQGAEPLADRARFSDWSAKFAVPHRDSQLSLFRTWIPKLPETSMVSCRNANELGLVCGHFWGQWSLLRAINLPVLLEIKLQDGMKTNVMVRREGDQQMTLLYGNSEAIFPTEEVLLQWTGRATIVGRHPSDNLENLSSSSPDLNTDPGRDYDESLADGFITKSGLGSHHKPSLLSFIGAQGGMINPKIPHLDDLSSDRTPLCPIKSRVQ